ncbi:MAG: hypothetical protein JWO06_2700, partial [Bacteroidota bacterium]|nr:hypothetical protein [Bacteroidota bacterium]
FELFLFLLMTTFIIITCALLVIVAIILFVILMFRIFRKGSNIVKEKESIELASHIFGIFAIVIGAIWAIWIFGLKDLPAMQKSLKIDSDSEVELVAPDRVHVFYTTVLKNICKTNIDVNKVEVSYWVIPNSLIFRERYFDFAKYSEGHPATFAPIQNQSLVGHYPPDVEYEDGFDFYLDKDTSSTILMLTKVNFSGNNWFGRKSSEPFDDYTYSTEILREPKKK